MEYPYKVDYTDAKTPVACSKCLQRIAAGDLKFATRVQSMKQDDREDRWHHEKCFFQAHKPRSQDDIQNFERLKYDDQLKILMTIDPESTETWNKIADKRAAEKPLSPNAIANFGIEYSTVNDSACFVCEEQIFRNEIRVKKLVYDSEVAAQFGQEIRWNHLECFVMQRDLYSFELSGHKLPGFKNLSAQHRCYVDQLLPCVSDVDVDETIVHDLLETETLPLTSQELEEKIAKQNAELLRVRQALEKVCSIDQLQYFLLMNESDGFDDKDKLLDRCADFLTFGALYKCQKCFNGDMIFNKNGYVCNAMISEWVKCGNFEAQPMRLKSLIPQDLKHKVFFSTCEPRVEDRAVRPTFVKADRDETIIEEPINARPAKVTKIVLKNGTAVDPQSRYANQSHVYLNNGIFYTSVLGFTDIELNKNSYHKLQVLESDNKPLKYWVFSSWGRIGTNIGDMLETPFASAALACAHFEKLYEEQTGNNWKTAMPFKKYPGKFYPIEITYEDDINANTSVASRLSPKVEELMKILFDIKAMKNALKEYHLDLEKMPLGKLSVNQMQTAFEALAQLETAILNQCPSNELVGLSNKFYTLIPHNFGLRKAPVLDTMDKVNEKREMVDSLLDIGAAYHMMAQGNAHKELNSFDAYYRQLNANIQHLDHASEEFKMIHTYVTNSQVHGYKVDLLEVFKVERQGEDERYAPFADLHNRQLLWHGSAVTNFASIISNGLKISQAVNGSMFGRGIYFADMISKSLNYCFNRLQAARPANSVLLLALNEVALGTMNELRNAQNITQLPPNMHSTKGLGVTVPDPNGYVTRANGSLVPLGRPVNSNRAAGLQFNEFIVYNEAQVKIQYLVQVIIR